MGWPSWLLLSVLALAAVLALSAWLIRFRYSFEYIFPRIAQGSMKLTFLWWRKEMPFGSPEVEVEYGKDDFSTASRRRHPSEGVKAAEAAKVAADSARGNVPQSPPQSETLRPRPGQGGFLAVPWKDRIAKFRIRLKAAALKWALDLAVWGHLAGYALRSGIRSLRFAGPSMQHLHVGSSNILALGRFASVWSSVSGMAPFLACPVEYGFNEKPFSLRFRVSGGCTALGVLGFGLTLLFTLPWTRLARRFLYCWRHPRLNRWQRRLLAAAA